MFKFRLLFVILFSLVIISCEDDGGDLPSVEERVSEAIDDLRDELTDPLNGWRLDYQPTPESGFFYILLDFTDDGLVNIQSDVADNEGEFFEQTIPYRIDNALGLELILETYGIFHYLFEQDQGNFGAEFEFIFLEKEGDNLVFESKSDVGARSRLTFVPATIDAPESFSREIAENLNAYDGLNTQIFGGDPPIQQLVLENQNISVFWSIDIAKRTMFVDIAAVGTTIEEVNQNQNDVTINHSTGYILLDGKLVLINPFTFSLNGQQITVDEIALNEFSTDGPSFCSLNMEATPVYKGDIEGIGEVTLLKSLFNSNGTGFQPMSDQAYGVNVIFVFDEEARSLAEEGSIFEYFPTATGFVFNYGLSSGDLPANAVGLTVEDEFGNFVTYLREFEATTTIGNKVQITLTDDFYYSETPGVDDEQNLRNITDEIFEGGEVYTFDLPVDGTAVFRLFNPCNRYELFLVQ